MGNTENICPLCHQVLWLCCDTQMSHCPVTSHHSSPRAEWIQGRSTTSLKRRVSSNIVPNIDAIYLSSSFIAESFEAGINKLPPPLPNLSKVRVEPELPSMPWVLEAALSPATAQMETESQSKAPALAAHLLKMIKMADEILHRQRNSLIKHLMKFNHIQRKVKIKSHSRAEKEELILKTSAVCEHVQTKELARGQETGGGGGE